MAQVTSKALVRDHREVLYGTLFAGTFTNTTYELVLEPGLWHIALFINANSVSAGTVTATITLPDGTFSESDTPEAIYFFNGATTPGITLSLIDFNGVTYLNGTTGGTNTPSGVATYAIAVYSTLRLTIASIAGASATNRIDYIAQLIN